MTLRPWIWYDLGDDAADAYIRNERRNLRLGIGDYQFGAAHLAKRILKYRAWSFYIINRVPSDDEQVDFVGDDPSQDLDPDFQFEVTDEYQIYVEQVDLLQACSKLAIRKERQKYLRSLGDAAMEEDMAPYDPSIEHTYEVERDRINRETVKSEQQRRVDEIRQKTANETAQLERQIANQRHQRAQQEQRLDAMEVELLPYGQKTGFEMLPRIRFPPEGSKPFQTTTDWGDVPPRPDIEERAGLPRVPSNGDSPKTFDNYETAFTKHMREVSPALIAASKRLNDAFQIECQTPYVIPGTQSGLQYSPDVPTISCNPTMKHMQELMRGGDPAMVFQSRPEAYGSSSEDVQAEVNDNIESATHRGSSTRNTSNDFNTGMCGGQGSKDCYNSLGFNPGPKPYDYSIRQSLGVEINRGGNETSSSSHTTTHVQPTAQTTSSGSDEMLGVIPGSCLDRMNRGEQIETVKRLGPTFVPGMAAQLTSEGGTPRSIQENLLLHGRHPYGHQTKTELRSLTFHDWTPDLKSGDKQRKLLYHIEGGGHVGCRIYKYEVSIPKIDRPLDSGPDIPFMDRWIWFSITRPLFDFDSMPGGGQNIVPPELGIVPTSTVIFAAPFTSTQIGHETIPIAKPTLIAETTTVYIRPERTDAVESHYVRYDEEFSPLHPEYVDYACDMIGNASNAAEDLTAMIEVPTTDYDFSYHGMPTFEFSSTRESTDSPNALIRTLLCPVTTDDSGQPLKDLKTGKPLKEIFEKTDSGKPLELCAAFMIQEDFVLPRGRNQFAYNSSFDVDASGNNQVVKHESVAQREIRMKMGFRNGLKRDAEHWKEIRAAMSRGHCRVVAKEETESLEIDGTKPKPLKNRMDMLPFMIYKGMEYFTQRELNQTIERMTAINAVGEEQYYRDYRMPTYRGLIIETPIAIPRLREDAIDGESDSGSSDEDIDGEETVAM